MTKDDLFGIFNAMTCPKTRFDAWAFLYLFPRVGRDLAIAKKGHQYKPAENKARLDGFLNRMPLCRRAASC